MWLAFATSIEQGSVLLADQRQVLSSHLDISKMIIDSLKLEGGFIPFKKFWKDFKLGDFSFRLFYFSFFSLIYSLHFLQLCGLCKSALNVKIFTILLSVHKYINVLLTYYLWTCYLVKTSVVLFKLLKYKI